MRKRWFPWRGFHGMEPAIENRHVAKRNFPSCSLRSQFTASQKPPLLFPNAKTVVSILWCPLYANGSLRSPFAWDFLWCSLYANGSLLSPFAWDFLWCSSCGFNPLKSRNGITIYGAKPIYAPENLDSFASLTLYVRFAHSIRSLRSLSKFFTRLWRVCADGESHPPARLVIASFRSL